jgi:hypothetical protein
LQSKYICTNFRYLFSLVKIDPVSVYCSLHSNFQFFLICEGQLLTLGFSFISIEAHSIILGFSLNWSSKFPSLWIWVLTHLFLLHRLRRCRHVATHLCEEVWQRVVKWVCIHWQWVYLLDLICIHWQCKTLLHVHPIKSRHVHICCHILGRYV